MLATCKSKEESEHHHLPKNEIHLVPRMFKVGLFRYGLLVIFCCSSKRISDQFHWNTFLPLLLSPSLIHNIQHLMVALEQIFGHKLPFKKRFSVNPCVEINNIDNIKLILQFMNYNKIYVSKLSLTLLLCCYRTRFPTECFPCRIHVILWKMDVRHLNRLIFEHLLRSATILIYVTII